MASNSKDYINALQDFTSSLQYLVDTLKSNYDNNNDAATMEEFSGANTDMFKMVEAIAEDVQDAKENSKKSLDNTKHILAEIKAIKKSKEGGLFDKISDKDSKKGLIDGVKSVTLIAGAVLAIGGAFKLIGDVDFMSVIALSIAMPLIAIAISQIGQLENLGPKKIVMMTAVLMGGSLAIVAASYILADIQPVNFAQFLTAIAISTTFAVLSYGMENMFEAVKDIKPKDLLMLPLTIGALAAGLLIASYELAFIQPITIAKFLTAVGIAAVFAVVGIGMGIFLKSIKSVNVKDLLMLPVTMVALSAAIVASSYILTFTQDVPFGNVVMASLAIAVAVTAMALPIFLLSKIGLDSILMGSLGAVIVSGAIALSSQLLSLGDYEGGPTVDWAMGVGLSMLAFLPAMLILGNPVTLTMMLFGAIGVMAVAGTIVAVAEILNSGDFTGGPTKEWAQGVGLSLIYFSEALAMATPSVWDFLMGTSLEDKIAGLKNVVSAMVEVAGFLAENSAPFKNGPPKEWAEGTGLAIKYFSEAMAMVEPSAWDFLMGNSLASKIEGIKSVVNAMVVVATYLSSMGKAGVFTGGPNKEWAEGTAGSIKAFAESMSLVEDLDDVEDSKDYILQIVDVMKQTATQLSGFDFTTSTIDKKWTSGFDAVVNSFIKAGEKNDEIKDGISAIESITDNLPDLMNSMRNVSTDSVENMLVLSVGITKLADSYTYLSKAIQGLNTDLTEMSEKSVQTLSAVSGTIMALSLSDASNLKTVLEDNQEALLKFFKDVTQTSAIGAGPQQKGPSMPFAPQKSVAKPAVKAGPSETAQQLAVLKEIKQEMMAMKGLLSKISSSNGELVDIMSTSNKKEIGIKTSVK
jgi:methyl-accepting chemotaxis protein